MSIQERFERELDSLVDRLRSMSLVRLAAEFPPFPSRADAVRALMSDIAEVALVSEGLPSRDVPRLGDESVGDQLAVLGRDLVNSCDDQQALAAFADRLKELRLSL